MSPMLLAFLFFCASHSLYSESPEENYVICNYAYSLRGENKQKTVDLHVIRKPMLMPGGKFLNSEWVFTCIPNLARTNRVSEIVEFYQARGQVITQPVYFFIAPDIEAIRYQRLRVFRSKKLLTYEVFFATRNREYLISIVPDARRSLMDKRSALAAKEFEDQLKLLLDGSRMQGLYEPTITEAVYRWRLGLIIGAVFLLLALLPGYFFWFRNRK